MSRANIQADRQVWPDEYIPCAHIKDCETAVKTKIFFKSSDKKKKTYLKRPEDIYIMTPEDNLKIPEDLYLKTKM